MGAAYDNIKFIEITCLCMCVHMCVDGVRVHMYMCIWYLGACVFERELTLCKFRCTCVCTNGGSQKAALVSSLVTLYLFWGQNLSLNLELTNLTRLACKRNPGIHIIPPLQLWDYRQVLPHVPFYMGTWILAQILTIVQQADSRTNHHPRHSKSPALIVPLDNYFHLVS